MFNNKTVLNALLRNNLAAFIEKSFLRVDQSQAYERNWHIEVLADYLQKCASGEIKRLIIRPLLKLNY